MFPNKYGIKEAERVTLPEIVNNFIYTIIPLFYTMGNFQGVSYIFLTHTKRVAAVFLIADFNN